MVIFVFITLVLLWLFQVFFLDKFYSSIKRSTIGNIANGIEIVLEESTNESLNSSEIANYITRIAVVNDISILLTNKNGVIYTGTEVAGNQFFSRFMNIDAYLKVFENSQKNIGTPQYLNISSYELFHLSNSQGKEIENVNKPPLENEIRKGQNIIYTNTVLNKNNEPVTIILFMELTPLSTTVETLKSQLVYVTIIMLLVAIFLAFFIANKIAKPIESITKAAKNLGKEKYDYQLEGLIIKEVSDLNETLHFADQELAKTEATRKEFLANISHDLRTPLTMIKGYSEVMRDIPGETTTENIQVIIDETTRLQTLVNDLLELSKLESNKNIIIRNEEFDLTESVKSIVDRFEAMLMAKGYNFEFESPGPANIVGDELKISQVIYNLINNAVTYTGDDKKIIINEIILPDKVRVEIKDTGTGIDATRIDDIWDRYYKIESSHKRPELGSGLGLSIVKSIIELHDGKVGVTTGKQGSIFWFELKKKTY